MANSSEHDNELSGSIKGGGEGRFDYLNDLRTLKQYVMFTGARADPRHERERQVATDRARASDPRHLRLHTAEESRRHSFILYGQQFASAQLRAACNSNRRLCEPGLPAAGHLTVPHLPSPVAGSVPATADPDRER